MIAIGSRIHTYLTITAVAILVNLVGFCSATFAAITVSEIRVVDSKGKGIKARIIELTRERKELDIDDTDANGILNKKFECQEWHKLFAKPIAGPYTQSEFLNCQTKMTLTVRNIEFFPEAAVRILVPFPAGSTQDALLRLITERLAASLKQDFILDNKPQKAGTLAPTEVATAAPNGYTLLLGTSSSLTVYPAIFSKLAYDSPKDFSPVAMLATVPNVLVSSPALKANTVTQLIEVAKANPGGIKFSSPGTGSIGHLAGEQLNIVAGTRFIHVPYKGNVQAMQSLISGEAVISFNPLPQLLPRITSGELKALAVTGDSRAPALPNVPTIAEAGIPDFAGSDWLGVLAPTGTPSRVVQKLNSEILRILAREDVRAKLLSEGVIPAGNTPDQFAAAIGADLARWKRVVRAASIKPK